MKTEVIKIDQNNMDTEALERAAAIIRDGGLVAFPTETVYGLGADALSAEASKKIYAAKGRPSDNPLIVHIGRMEDLETVAANVPESARKLAAACWPGPLTMIFPKKEAVPKSTTGGLETVAVRMPSHPVARALIRESGVYIAAPSANTSGRPSPTKAEHVKEDLDGRIDMILDGGAVGIGLESTIVDLSTGVPTILRPGYITGEMLEDVLGEVQVDPAILSQKMNPNIVAKAPGMKYRHYAPKGQMTIIDGDTGKVVDEINRLVKEKTDEGCSVAVIATEETKDAYACANVRSVGSRATEGSIAAGLYDILREMDHIGAEYIYAESFEKDTLGKAIMNRMLKAAAYHVIKV